MKTLDTCGLPAGSCKDAPMTDNALKDQNTARLVAVWVWNAIVFILIFLGFEIPLNNWKLLLEAPKWQQIVFTPLVASGIVILNGLLSPNLKVRLVFLWRKNPHPASRAFSKLAKNDVRIDFAKLTELEGGALPESPVQQNNSWYRHYRSVQDDAAVLSGHRDYLYARDYASMLFIFGIIMTLFGIYYSENEYFFIYYLIFVIAQYVIVVRAAVQFGDRFVATALAKSLATKA